MARRAVEAIEGLILLEPRKHGDARGFFSETYSRRRLAEAGFDADFVQDNHSLSVEAGVVRGLHFQSPPHAQAKLVRVVRGAILDVAVDIRRGSPTWGDHAAVELSAANWRQLLVPEGFAHGFVTLEPETEVVYKVTAYYAPDHDHGLLWSDPALGIDWGIDPAAAILSDKDRAQPRLAALASPFEMAGA
jgi:dTDP-4-dehydrorhamnose 3,5-epimerase